MGRGLVCMRAGSATACLLWLAGCAALAEQEAAWQQQEAERRSAFCTSAGYAPDTDAHRICQQIEALNQRLDLVERRIDRIELQPISPYPRYRYWP